MGEMRPERPSRHAMQRARERLGIRLPDDQVAALLGALWAAGRPALEADFLGIDARAYDGYEYRLAVWRREKWLMARAAGSSILVTFMKV